MTSPFFYIDHAVALQQELVLNEDTSRHIVQVLRMKPGETVTITDGIGNVATCVITGDNKKKCTVRVQDTLHQPSPLRRISIAVSLLKNAGRFEWFLEKATEIGVDEIIPLVCERTEKQNFRTGRLQGILVSALLQSRQSRLPVLNEPASFKKIAEQAGQEQKFIAHCLVDQKKNLTEVAASSTASQIILIGPEGDFTKKEIELALQAQFIPVTLGETRLRTETAALVAAVLLKNSI